MNGRRIPPFVGGFAHLNLPLEQRHNFFLLTSLDVQPNNFCRSFRPRFGLLELFPASLAVSKDGRISQKAEHFVTEVDWETCFFS